MCIRDSYGAGSGTGLGPLGNRHFMQSVGEDGTNKNLPPYYALCYLIKAFNTRATAINSTPGPPGPPSTVAGPPGPPGTGAGVPQYTIVMYHGDTAPSGWVLCDNSIAAQAAGAPDLRDRFIVGAGNYTAGSQGAHQHEITDRSSQDSGDGFEGYQEGQGGDGSNNVTSSSNGAHTHTVTGTSGGNTTQLSLIHI